MKKLMMIAVMMVVALTANAQNEPGKMAIGANLNYGMHKDYKNIGFGAKFQYNFTDAIRGEASGNYFLKKDYCTMWDANINLHYVIPVSEGLNVYPLVGATLVGVKVDFDGAGGGHNLDYYYNQAKDQYVAAGGSAADFDAYWPQVKAQYEKYVGEAGDGASASETKFGFNVGAGIEYFLSESLKVNAEVKYQYVKDFDRPVISAGISYIF